MLPCAACKCLMVAITAKPASKHAVLVITCTKCGCVTTVLLGEGR